MNKAELAAFLRARRDALRPAQSELGSSRRRTQGLRREEVAARANMSVDYYSRLEQQRAPQPSEQMMTAVAQALRLSTDERDHLLRLAGYAVSPPSLPPGYVGPGLMRVLDRLEDTPAMVATDLGETLAQNRLAAALFGDHDGLVGPARNLIYRWFTDPEARHRFPPEDHEYEGRSLVADLRAVVARHRGDASSTALLNALLADSQEFTALWHEQQVAIRRTDHKRILHPEVGLIELECQALTAESQAQILAVFTPTPGTGSVERLQRLAAVSETSAQR